MKTTPLGPTNNPGKARWCADHGRLECTRHRTKGRGTCHQAAVRGTDACLNHSGFSVAVQKVRGEAQITAWNPESKDAPTIDASSAVLRVLQMSYLRLSVFSRLLQGQIATEGDKAGSAGEDAPDTSGLIGFRYGMGGKEGITYIQTEEIRALVVLEAAERDRVVKYAKTAHDMGISTRLTAMAEQWGDIVAGRVSMLLEALDLSPEQVIRVPSLLQTHLGSIDMTAIEGGTE